MHIALRNTCNGHVLTCREFSIVNSHVNTKVYLFTESNPNIHVHPSTGSKMMDDLMRYLNNLGGKRITENKKFRLSLHNCTSVVLGKRSIIRFWLGLPK